MSDLATKLQSELIDLNEAARRAARTALSLNDPQAEALKMIAAFTERLIKETGPGPSVKH